MDLRALARPARRLRRVVGAAACCRDVAHAGRSPHAWVVAFYLLAIIFNYPHFMATIYRAYHTREDFEKYKIFTLHVTLLLVLTGDAAARVVSAVFRGSSPSTSAGARGTTRARTTAC